MPKLEIERIKGLVHFHHKRVPFLTITGMRNIEGFICGCTMSRNVA
jgi:hypothetical protein